MLGANDTIYMSEGRQTAFDDLLFESVTSFSFPRLATN